MAESYIERLRRENLEAKKASLEKYNAERDASVYGQYAREDLEVAQLAPGGVSEVVANMGVDIYGADRTKASDIGIAAAVEHGLDIGTGARATQVTLPGGAIPDAIIFDAALKAGFTPSEATTMLAIALAESGGVPFAHNPRGEDSRGIWQINIDPTRDANADLGHMELYDPYENAKAAKIIYDRQSISAWTVTHGSANARYRTYAVRASEEAARQGYLEVNAYWGGVSGYKQRHSALDGDQDASRWTGNAVPLPEWDFDEVIDDYGFASGEGGDEDAWTIAKQMLADYGLSSLFPQVEQYILKGLSAEAAVGRVRDTPQFKERFAGMLARVENGYNAISPASYLAWETAIQDLMGEAGFPSSFYDEPSDFAAFIANDVGAPEISDRISLAQKAVMNADPLVKQELQEKYGIGLDSDADLVAYFLDPERAVPLLDLKVQVGAAGLSAAAQRAMGAGRKIGTETAEELARRGYSTREIGERLKGRGGLTQKLLGERGGVTGTEVAAAEFGLDSEAVANLKRLRQDRQELGKRRSGAMLSQAGVSGFGSAA